MSFKLFATSNEKWRTFLLTFVNAFNVKCQMMYFFVFFVLLLAIFAVKWCTLSFYLTFGCFCCRMKGWRLMSSSIWLAGLSSPHWLRSLCPHLEFDQKIKNLILSFNFLKGDEQNWFFWPNIKNDFYRPKITNLDQFKIILIPVNLKTLVKLHENT